MGDAHRVAGAQDTGSATVKVCHATGAYLAAAAAPAGSAAAAVAPQSVPAGPRSGGRVAAARAASAFRRHLDHVRTSSPLQLLLLLQPLQLLLRPVADEEPRALT